MDFQFLIEMAWKSALISGSALAMAAMLRGRSAGERSALLGTAVALIVALPIITLLLPSLTVVTGTVREAASTPLTPAELAALAASAPIAARGAFDDPTPLLELLWAGGALMVLIRLAAGLWTLDRWTRGGSDVACAAWLDALNRAAERTGCRRDVRLLVSDAPSPLSWGSLKPVILLDRDTVRDPGEADAVLAHELAHVVRGDWLVLILARVAIALFWFNPLMWLLERRIVNEAEEAADARALEHVDPARYAQTLLSCAQQQAAPRLPASGMADAGLGRRVRAILERRLRSGAPDPRWIRAAVVVATLIAAPIAALKPVVAVIRSEAPRAPAAPAAPPAPVAPHAPGAPAAASPAPAAPMPPETLAVLAAAGLAPPAPTAPTAPLAPLAPRSAFAPPAPPAPPARLRPLIDADEISRDVQEAIEEAMRDKEEALADAAEAREDAIRELRDAAEANEESGVSAAVRAQAFRDAQQALREARRVSGQALAAARRGMAEGAHGMIEGARGMEEGAAHLDREADKLRSRDYREQQIARAAREGRTLTHQQLLDMIPRFHESAQGMRRGAEAMRRNAEKMRRQG
jgi:beta-lactamase regulating signal transducer with metallopeptidase domain